MPITTLTLHPALDRLLDAKRVELGGLFDVQLRGVIPAGKGINTARILRRLVKGPVSAVAWVGADDASLFSKTLRRERVTPKLCARPCATRWGVTLLEAGGRETHFKETMPSPSRQEEQSFTRFLAGLRGGMMAVCGSAPPGTRVSLLRSVMRRLREQFKLLVVDSSGPLLDIAGRTRCDGLKGNAAEIGVWLGLCGPWDPGKRSHRQQLMDRLGAHNATRPQAVMVTLGSRGAALATRQGFWVARAPLVPRSKIVSPTGCGDAATAGWLWALSERALPEEALRRAVACGTAKLFNGDPGVLTVRTVQRLMKNVGIGT